jgi:hypothetical protein
MAILVTVKVRVAQLVKKFPPFNKTKNPINFFAEVCH